MLVLGLDISTSITGYCIMDSKAPLGDRLLVTDSINLTKEKDPYGKASMVRRLFENLKKEYDIDEIYVEENLQAFRRGLSSAKTLSTLARFNGVVSFLAQDVFQTPVRMLNVNHARKSVGLKTDRKIKKETPIKEQVVNWVKLQPDFKNFVWPTKTLKSGPRKGVTVMAPRCFDIADASVICLAGLSV